jgi:hypothetical protein
VAADLHLPVDAPVQRHSPVRTPLRGIARGMEPVRVENIADELARHP